MQLETVSHWSLGMLSPQVQEYSDFRNYLKDAYKFRKKQDSSFTHRFIVNNVQASSSGWFSDIINGRITLSHTYRLRLSDLLEHSETDKEYFHNLIEFNQAGSSEERTVFFKRLLLSKAPDAQIIIEYQFDFYRLWYVSAIRELLVEYNFDGQNFSTLGSLLIPCITTEEARYAFDILLQCNLIALKAGKYKPTNLSIKKAHGFTNFYWKLYMESMLKQSENAIHISKEIRDISAITVNLDTETFKEAQIIIAECRRKLLMLEQIERSSSRVYQCNIQLFPLSEEFHHDQ